MSSSRLRRGAAVGVVVAGMLAVAGSPAVATSCGGHEDASAAAILDGEERLGTMRPFDADYRGAVLGTVTDLDTDEREGSATYGSTVVRMDVLGTHGDVAAGRARIEMPDPGWMLGYGFEAGGTYFVPVRHEPTDVMACEPITRVAEDEVPALLDTLSAPAADTLLTISGSEIAATPAAAEAPDGGVPAWLWVAVGVIAAGVLAITAIAGHD